MAGHSITESMNLCKHKDWPVHALYIQAMKCSLKPVIQSLQSPTFLSHCPGKVLSLAAVSAQVSAAEAKMIYAVADKAAGSAVTIAKNAFDLTLAMAESLQACLLNNAHQDPLVTISTKLQAAISLTNQLKTALNNATGDAQSASIVLQRMQQTQHPKLPLHATQAATVSLHSSNRSV